MLVEKEGIVREVEANRLQFFLERGYRQVEEPKEEPKEEPAQPKEGAKSRGKK